MDNINIIEPNNLFDFSQITLGNPTNLQGGSYFTKILYDKKPLYIQSPKCLTKQGFVKSGKKIYCDLMFDNNDEEFIHWVENLENKCQKLIFDKSGEWFENSLELNDIESAFNSTIKLYKSGKFYLLRTNIRVNSLTGVALVKIYNDDEVMMNMDDITSDTNIISIIEVQGIRFSTRNFQIELELKQMMTINTDEVFERNCLIKKGSSKASFQQNSFTNNLGPTKKTENNKLESQLESEPEISLAEEVLKEVDEEKNIITDNININILENIKENEEREKNSLGSQTLLLLDEGSQSQLEENVKSDNIDLQIEDLAEPIEFKELGEEELKLNLENNSETIKLRKPNEVYYEIYKKAREKAKELKKNAIVAYLEAKNIKKTYMLEDIDSSDESSIDNFSESEYSENEIDEEMEE